MEDTSLNVFGKPLIACCYEPLTGYFRDGFCKTIEEDSGTHVVCAQVTEAFLNFSANRGNNLITPRPEWNFPGLKPGDFWCLCVSRWLEAEKAGVAPKLKLEACHQETLNYTTLNLLEQYAL